MKNSIWSIVQEYLDTRQGLSSAKSPLGAQLDMLRLGLTGAQDDFRRAEAAEARYFRYASLVKMWASLDQDEQLCVEAQHSPNGTQEYTRIVADSDLYDLYVPLHELTPGPCNAITSNGGLCRNPRVVGEPRCGIKAHIEQVARPVTRVTRRGEEYMCAAVDETKGNTLEGYSMVRGRKDKFPTIVEIAETLGKPVKWVSLKVNTASAKVRARLAEEE